MNVGLLNYVPARRQATGLLAGIGACGPCSRISPLSGLGVTDFGGGVDSYGRQRVMAPMNADGEFMMSTVQGFSTKSNVPTLRTRLMQVVRAWETVSPEQVVTGNIGYDTESPDSARTVLRDIAANHCQMYYDTCVGVNVEGLISEIVAKYTQWWNSALANYYDMVASGAIPRRPVEKFGPPSGYVPYNQVAGYSGPIPKFTGETVANEFFGGPARPVVNNPVVDNTTSPQPANTLDAVTPTTQTWYQAPTASVVNPPSSGGPVPFGSIVQNTGGSQALTTGVNEQTTESGTDPAEWVKKNWVLVAAGVAALFFLTRGK